LLPDGLTQSAHAWYLGAVWLPGQDDSGEPDLTVARALLNPGASAIDGGANFGRYADAFAEAVGPNGSVIAVEPVPRTALLLRRVMRHRNRGQVSVAEVALGAAPGRGLMEVPSSPAGEINFFRAHLHEGGNGAETFEVGVVTLDEISRRLPASPSLVKLDLEGHERPALAGSAETLTCGAAWIIEMNDDPDDASSDAHAIEALFAERGYRPWIWQSGTLRTRDAGPRGPNVFLLLPAHLEQLKRAGIPVIE
jgi:FkbM family methyltransferase